MSISEADIRNPLYYLLITLLGDIAAYQNGLVSLLIRSSPPPLIALNNIKWETPFLDSVKKDV